jgi:hypothetical protein
LLDRTANEDSRRHLERLLWGEVAALSKMYYEKGEKIIGLSYKVLEYCDPHLCQGQF